MFFEDFELCTMCTSSDLYLCTTCKAAAYCSEGCQKLDWPLHKLLCKKYQSFLETRPSAWHKIGIRLPADSEMPQLIWVRIKPTPDQCWDAMCTLQADMDRLEGNMDSVEADMDSLRADMDFLETDLSQEEIMQMHKNLGVDKPNAGPFYIAHNGVYRFSCAIQGFCRDGHLEDGSQPNICISKLAGGESGDQWRGALAFAGLCDIKDGEEVRRRDLTLSDLSHLVAWFGRFSTFKHPQVELNVSVSLPPGYEQRMATQSSHAAQPAKKVKAVIIRCVGSQAASAGVKYISTSIDSNHDIFRSDGNVCAVTKQMKLPILLDKLQMSDVAKKDRSFSLQNEAAFYLNINTSNTTPQFPWDSPQTMGDVLVVRQDQKDITPHQIEAISRYAQYELLPIMHVSSCSFLYYSKQQFVKDFMNRSKFEEYLEFHKYHRAAGLIRGDCEEDHKLDTTLDPSWAWEISPYLT